MKPTSLLTTLWDLTLPSTAFGAVGRKSSSMVFSTSVGTTPKPRQALVRPTRSQSGKYVTFKLELEPFLFRPGCQHVSGGPPRLATASARTRNSVLKCRRPTAFGFPAGVNGHSSYYPSVRNYIIVHTPGGNGIQGPCQRFVSKLWTKYVCQWMGHPYHRCQKTSNH